MNDVCLILGRLIKVTSFLEQSFGGSQERIDVLTSLVTGVTASLDCCFYKQIVDVKVRGTRYEGKTFGYELCASLADMYIAFSLPAIVQ